MVARFEHGSPGFSERWLQNLPKGRSVMPRLSRPSVLFLPVRTLAVRTLAARTLAARSRDTLSASGGAQPGRSRRGFTLIELLVVMMIIAILASMISFAMSRVQQTARKAATQAQITKLHSVIARQWDTFETGIAPSGWSAAKWRADEMPCSAGEIQRTSEAAGSFVNKTIAQHVDPVEGDTDAQCLYQVIMQIADDDLDRINFFSEAEVKIISKADKASVNMKEPVDDGMGKFYCEDSNYVYDKDYGADGVCCPQGYVYDPNPDDPVLPCKPMTIYVFVDAWENPIGFTREPTGFVPESDLMDAADGIVFPLIYSNGPDTSEGLDTTGAPDGTGDHNDNIHNHHLGGSLR